MTTTTGTGTSTQVKGASPKITFYTNHNCPWAHRAAITLKELELPYEEVIIPLDRPRDEWYLQINPRGLVPTIKFSNGVLEDEIITESTIVTTFLADSFPKGGFYPASHESPTSALIRARMNFFADTFITKANSSTFQILLADGKEKEELAAKMTGAIKKEIEPLLHNAGPFFGGSKTMTLAEALTASFVIRYKAYMDYGLFPATVAKDLDALPNYTKWSNAVCSQESVTYVFDAPAMAKGMSERIAKMKSDKK